MSSDIKIKLERLITEFTNSLPSQETLNQHTFQPVLDNIEKLSVTAEKNKLLGFQHVCLIMKKTFSDLFKKLNGLDERQYELLKQWRILSANYIRDGKASTVNALVNYFNYPELNTTINPNDLSKLKNLLIKQALKNDIDTKTLVFLFSKSIDSLQTENSVDLKLLNKKLEELLNSLTKYNLNGFQNICLLIKKNINHLKPIENLLSNKQKKLLLDLLKQLQLFLNDNNNDTAIIKLVDMLKDNNWPLPISDADAVDILNIFNIATPSNAILAQSTSDKKQNRLIQLNTKLSTLASRIKRQDKKIIAEFADIINDISLVAEDMHLTGFQDACLIIKENIMDMINDTDITDEYITHLKQCPIIIRAYLADINNPNLVSSLLNYLSSAQWVNPLTPDNSKIIREMMITEEQQNNTLNEVSEEIIDINDIMATPHTINQELVKILLKEISLFKNDIEQYFNIKFQNKINQTEKENCLLTYSARIERFGNACQAAEMDGLYQACMVFHKNLNILAKHPNDLTAYQQNLLKSWPEKIKAYLNDPGNDAYCNALVDVIQDDHLPKKLMKGISPALINLLKAVSISKKDNNKEKKKTIATAKDISIELPKDINLDLLDALLQELPEQTESFSALIQTFINDSGNISDIQKAQRIAHTIKGAANTVGIKGISVLTHQLEDILSALCQLNHLPPPALTSTLMDASDCLVEMSENLLKKDPTPPPQSQTILQNILNWVNQIENKGVECLKFDKTSTSYHITKKTINEKRKKEETENTPTLRVPIDLIDKILQLIGKTEIMTSQLQERALQSSRQAQKLIEHQTMVNTLTSDLELQIDIKGATHKQKKFIHQDDIFDPLELEEYNELHTITHRIIEATADAYKFNQMIVEELRDLNELLIKKNKLHQEIQTLVLRTRMIPIKTIVSRLQRIVRQTCRVTRKKASLDIIGENILIDSDILNNLFDPLMHILRNAIDHGIESSEDRIKKGKNASGKIELQFSRENAQILVRCKDDGIGLDYKKILETAIRNGLIKSENKLTENEINRLILYPDFSTCQQTTQTSGRGIGMNIVHTKIMALKGSVHIESKKDNGCLIELRLPITLMSSNVLLLRHFDQIIAVSNYGIEKILHPSDSQIMKSNDGKTYCRFDGEKIELLTLESLLNLTPSASHKEGIETGCPALLIRQEKLNYIVHIHQILDVRSLFIKSMGKYLNKITGLLGATILGDGSIIPVIDLPKLIQSSINRPTYTNRLYTNKPHTLPIALIVDDSLTARRALTQTIKDIGFDIQTAKNGLEAIHIIKKNKPDIMLIDMEMPKMNGIELTLHVRSLETTKNIPIIMITSRSTEKHRKKAHDVGVNVYVTKPFSEDNLLDHVHSLLN